VRTNAQLCAIICAGGESDEPTTNGVNGSSLEPTVRVLSQLSPQAQEIASSLVRQLVEREGITVALTTTPGLQTREF
jgi:hypothetical protein